ncbi:unnamed protein product [Vitrella brassicaformis CCMP3155]|uniref:Transcription factor CBF/NF-Y/archaeal histone domain-containing protein n=2 Tax=Vitrella brassicaformis TaxID=1169539 RepID=A0A0G4EWH4_VITBC|nr:unnamed protein product [Vitrella brassicaformis CCMP3155]|mmetsp:Transcript_23172/g.57322  ORF Transcript_23172/g.57322 Transcript_23172/m.57322 type:complete len:313 (+) Transcript_23172:100-1038(+)|eukprot:CEM03312.1 unnamed protein product [Vitrella brassicaformis CCMP3155]
MSADEGDSHFFAEAKCEGEKMLPVANVGRIMKRILPTNAKIAKDAKETMQECVTEFIAFITSEASEKCLLEKRKTLGGDDIINALGNLGFEKYQEPLRKYLDRYREHAPAEAAGKYMPAASADRGLAGMGGSSSTMGGMFGMHPSQTQQRAGMPPQFAGPPGMPGMPFGGAPHGLQGFPALPQAARINPAAFMQHAAVASQMASIHGQAGAHPFGPAGAAGPPTASPQMHARGFPSLMSSGSASAAGLPAGGHQDDGLHHEDVAIGGASLIKQEDVPIGGASLIKMDHEGEGIHGGPGPVIKHDDDDDDDDD